MRCDQPIVDLWALDRNARTPMIAFGLGGRGLTMGRRLDTVEEVAVSCRGCDFGE